MLNIPHRFEEEIISSLSEGKKILLLGSGGSFDVVAALPLYYTLRLKGYELEIANYSLVDFSLFPQLAEPHVVNNNIVGANALIKGNVEHFPEGHLSAWFKSGYNEDVIVWMLRKQAAPDLIVSLTQLAEKLNVGLIIMCSAGTHLIMKGDEEGCGDMLHSTIALAAIRQVDVRSLIFTLGINTDGSRRSESLFNSLENIQGYVMDGGYYGCCALEQGMDSFLYYKSAYEYIVDQPMHNKSPVHELTMTSVLGGFGLHVTGGFISPLSSQAHFFDAITVSNRNVIIPYVESIPSYDDMVPVALRIIQNPNKRPRAVVEA